MVGVCDRVNEHSSVLLYADPKNAPAKKRVTIAFQTDALSEPAQEFLVLPERALSLGINKFSFFVLDSHNNHGMRKHDDFGVTTQQKMSCSTNKTP